MQKHTSRKHHKRTNEENEYYKSHKKSKTKEEKEISEYEDEGYEERNNKKHKKKRKNSDDDYYDRKRYKEEPKRKYEHDEKYKKEKYIKEETEEELERRRRKIKEVKEKVSLELEKRRQKIKEESKDVFSEDSPDVDFRNRQDESSHEEEEEEEEEDIDRKRNRKKKKKKSSNYEQYSDSEYDERKNREERHRKHKKRDRDDKRRRRHRRSESEDELEHISRPVEVGSRYYDVNKPIDEENITYKEPDPERYYPDKVETKPEKPKTTTNILSSKTGGAYIPPAKLKLMQQSITDKSSAEYQRIAWEALKKTIHGSVNKVNTGNIGIIARKLFSENIIRGRGLLTRSILQAQAASPSFTNVYAALVDIINSKFPSIGELLLHRCVTQFKRCFKRNDKAMCINSATFIAHLVNQQVAHEILALEVLTLLVETPTNDSVEVACALLKECGKKLTELSSRGVAAIFQMLLNILHEGKLDKRVQYMIEVLAQVRKDDFKDFPDVIEELDLVPLEDKVTHLMTLDGVKDTQDLLNVFQFDPDYQVNEDKYKALKEEILGGSDDDDDDFGEGEDDDDDDEEDEEEEGEKKENTTIIDNTETNLVALRRTIYLTIHSSLDYEECAHKLLKMQLKPGQESELCNMFLDCCAEQRTYEKFFGLLAQRFCMVNKIYIAPLEQIFRDSYSTVHRLEINKLRNVAKFFGHLLFTDAIGWHVLACVRLTEEDTTSSGRIFIKILFQELAEYLGLSKLNQKLKDPLVVPALEGVFPRDNPKNTRFAINFFTSIGLGGLTDELREHLKSQPKAPLMLQNLSSPSSSSSSSSSDSSSSSSSSSSSEEERRRKRKKKKRKA